MSTKAEWYITFHGGDERSDLNNIHVYSGDGRKLRKALDRRSLPASLELRELRGFAFGPDGNLYVANAFCEFSEVLRFEGHLNERRKHRFMDVFVDGDAIRNPGLSHPFSVAFDGRGDLYVTSQSTSLVLRYHGPTSREGAPGRPMPLPSALTGDRFHPGTFCASSAHVEHGLKVVREAVIAGGVLYVVDRDADCVRKFDVATGAWLGRIAADGLIDQPIQLLASGQTLFIGNKGNESVVKCDLGTGRVTPFVYPKAGGLRNPSGLALGGDGWLYVAARTTRQILRFRLTDGTPDVRPFIAELDDDPEFIESVRLADLSRVG